MSIIKDEVGLLNRVKRKATLMGDKVLIVSKPEKARTFWFDIRNDILRNRKVYKNLITQVKQHKHLTHEIENLLDNYYIIDSAISDILNTTFDKGFRRLFQVERKTDFFVPRVYSILIELLEESEYKISREILYTFLHTYQIKAHLSIRELSFIPFFLRVILIKKIEGLMHKSIVSLEEYSEAEYWFDQIVKKGAQNKNSDYLELTSSLTRKYGVVPINLGFYLLQKLSQYGPDTRPVVKWLKLNLLKQGVDISDLAEIENKRQAEISDQISNIINSLRWVNQARWDDFVVDVNIADSFLIKDPANIYAQMDKASQSVYRNELVKISDRAGIYETEVAKLALRLCQRPTLANLGVLAENHVGYYLVGDGRDELEKKVGYKKPFWEKIRTFILERPTPMYLGVILFLNVILTILFVLVFNLGLGQSIPLLVLLTLVFILNWDITLNLVNILISTLIPVRSLFRLDLSAGLTREQATFVVIPSMFRDIKSAQDLLRRLEVNFLGNTDKEIYFALLMDFKDSQMETLPSDQNIVDHIEKGIEELNKKYPSNIKRFYLFHRRRIWNPRENVFMGWERKRGKLREFNLLLRNKRETSYVENFPADLPYIKYILTIDEDTRLPKDSAIKLIGCIDHPLNRPVVDTNTNKVVQGYGIIQPRMTSKFSSARATAFSRLFSSSMGIDSYSGPAADVYQDLFNNSIFYGKGIYDVDTMEAVIGDRIPENQVLSHDLLEGIYTRVGFATDISLFEGFPESYKEYGVRMERWIRGDWQIIGWLKGGNSRGGSFSVSDKWKIFDNLRRSTLPIFTLLFLLLSHFYFNNLFPYFLVYTLMVIGSSFIICYLLRFFEWPKEMTLLMKIDNLFDNLDDVIIQIVCRFIFLLDQGVISIRAIAVSLYRMLISHKRMLLWQSSHEVSKGLKGTFREFVFSMWPTVVTSLILLVLLSNYHESFYSYLAVALWFVSPLVAYHISRKDKVYEYSEKDLKFLRRIACRSARFFLELSRRGGNHLIPDHYQEEPLINSPGATSPTNIGMHLLSNLSMLDFGYISFSNFLERTGQVFDSLNKMERYNGHFYNWYDIHSLQSLNPKYVSSVDSANLLMSLLTLKQGILDIMSKPIVNKACLNGFFDILAVMAEDSKSIIKDKKLSKLERKLARQVYQEVQTILSKNDFNQDFNSASSLSRFLDGLHDGNEKIKRIVSHLNLGLDTGGLSSIYSSAEHLNLLLKQQVDEINTFLPFGQIWRARPVIRNEMENNLLAKTMADIYTKLDSLSSLRYSGYGLKAEIEKLDLISIIHSSNLDHREKDNLEHWFHQVMNTLTTIQGQATKKVSEFENIILLINKFIAETDFAFLYNQERGLFHIGYNVTYNKIDNSYYDFMASEANAISFISIMKGDVPIKHWFYLGRKLVKVNLKDVLLSSWGGSLFEYLTSLIFFKVHKESLLGRTAELAISSHMKYGLQNNVPWGMGESAHSTFDVNNNYQYQIFGHPSLGLRSDLKDYLVVAPYTTIMSLAFKPKEAIANLRRLDKSKFLNRYGFYDAIDYTRDFFGKKFSKEGVPAKIYYAHHQGFSLQALNNQINNDRIRSLFIRDPHVESLDTLLEERVPSSIPSAPLKNLERVKIDYLAAGSEKEEVKQFVPLITAYPRRAFISNSSYFVNISNTGAGGSRVDDISLTRFREDTVTEPWGQFIYLHDVEKNILWSPTVQPINSALGKNKIEYFENKAKFNKIHNDIESSLLVAVASDSNVEFRSLVLTNHGKETKKIKVSSYGEVALSRGSEDLHHTAFEKLFTESEYWPKYKALIYNRSNKSERGAKLYFAHAIVLSSANKQESNFITNRAEIIPRGGSIKEPDFSLTLSSDSKVDPHYNLDSVFGFQSNIELKNNETITINYVNVFGNSEEEIVNSLRRYSSQKNINHAIKISDKSGHTLINSLGLSQIQALNYQALASRLLSPHYSNNPKIALEESHEAAVQSLWRLGISGDLPILLVRFYDMNDLAMVKNMLLCHKYLKHKGVAHDLVLLNEYPSSYIKSFDDEVDFLIRYNRAPVGKVVRGEVLHLKSSHMTEMDKKRLSYLSRVSIDGKDGSIEKQIAGILQSNHRLPTARFKAIKKAGSSGRDVCPDLSKLKFFNGIGGFREKDREYVMNINYSKSLYTPVPWPNIIANDNIGFVVTESGSMYTWLIDSYDNRITRRIDDSLIDRSSEVFYLRDEESGEFWNPTPLPIKSKHTYTIRHGLGYSSFTSKIWGVEQEMLVYVPVSESVKIYKFKLRNTTKISKKLSLTSYFEMSLGGANREDTKDYLKTFRDEETGAIMTRNIFNESFKGTLAFIDVNAGDNLITNDREEFLGKNGDLVNPAIMHREKLSNAVHDDVDHCVALQNFFELGPEEEKEIVVLLGGGNSEVEMRNLIKKYRDIHNCKVGLEQVKNKWLADLDRVKIKTPDESLDMLFNSRLLYQLISSRLLARTGYSQPSGAYGFRDQLQDSMALVWTKPEVTKDIILKASAHQFMEGDAQNWWHEHNDFGIRTTFSDQQLWLPYVVAFYIENTADYSILDENRPYMKAPLLDFLNNSHWAGVPEMTTEKYSLYDHCLRAIEKTFVFGDNGLPLIGNGDWNDGLNKVGEKGQGESVWLGWFLYYVINKFIPYIRKSGDEDRIKRYEITANNLMRSLEHKAWDGKWYKRAFFDNGNPLGSHSNKEFKIDSISQSWSVLSGAAKPERSKQAMQSVLKYLFQDELLQLISPAIKNSLIDPGYIKDYPAGVRENGAQYNHAALWAAQAFARIGDSASVMRVINSVNPIKRSDSKEKVSLYRAEPYVVASDIYAKPMETGRAGWTWYTGSAGVMYRLILESILGFNISGNKLKINPCIPKDWTVFSVTYKYKNTEYNIKVFNNLSVAGAKKIKVDGVLLAGEIIDLIDDNNLHEVEVKL